jgi:O-antigen ligase
LGQLKAFVVEPVLLFYAVILLFKKDDLVIPIRWLFWSSVIIAALGLLQYPTLIFLPMRFWGTGLEVQRITSFFEYPNALALFLSPLFGFFLVITLNNFKFSPKKWLDILGLIMIFLGIVLTFSRGAWIALGLTIFFLGFKRFGLKKTIVPAIILILTLLVTPQTRQRITLGLTDPSSLAHRELMTVAVNKVMASPLTGNGLYGFRTTLVNANFTGEILNYPHNIFLNFWLELGLLGLISFSLILIEVFKQNKKSPNTYTFAVGIFMIILLIHGLFDAPYFKNDLAILFWFMTSLSFI